VVPAGLVTVDIGIGPLMGGEVEADSAVVSSLGVPSTVGKELSFGTENGVSTTSKGKGLKADDGFQVFPGLVFTVESVNVIERDTGVVQTTMSTIDVDLALVVAGGGVSTRRRSTDRGFFVLSHGLVSGAAGPGVVLDVEDPGVIEAGSRISVPSEDEHLVVTDGQSNMLSTGLGLLGTLRLLLFPDPVSAGHFEGVDVRDRRNLVARGSGRNSTEH
jgi:hypothetical protein